MTETPEQRNADDELATRHVDRHELDALIAGLAGRDPNAPLVDGAWQIGPYRLSRELGRGSMGTVFLASHVALQREVALKVLPIAAAYAPEARERFLREAKALAKVEHPSVVRIHDVIEAHGTLAIAMERIDGPTLADVIARLAQETPSGTAPSAAQLARALGVEADALPLPGGYARWVTAIGIELADALQAVHDSGLTHRDVKPSNVLLDSSGHAHLADFGVVRDADASMTGSGGFVGTAPYAAPEQLRGEASVDGRVDVYGLGATLYEAFALVPPFHGSPATILDAVQRGAVKPLEQRMPGIARDLALVVHTALAPEVGRRYASAGRLAGDLRAFRDGLPLSVRPTTRLERLALWARREPARARLAAVAAAAFLGLVLVGTYFLSQLPRIQAAIEVERDLRFDEIVEQAYLTSARDRSLEEAIDLFDAALEIHPDAPLALGGLALAHAANGDVTRARATLTARPELLAATPGLRYLADAGVELLTSPPGVDRRLLEESTDALECFFAALSARARARSLLYPERRPDLMKEVEALLERAFILRIPAPRIFRSELAAAAAAAGDRDHARLHVQSLRTRWPDSPTIAFRSATVLLDADCASDAWSATETPAFARFDADAGTMLRAKILIALERTGEASAELDKIPESSLEFDVAMFRKAELLCGGPMIAKADREPENLVPAARECLERALAQLHRRYAQIDHAASAARNLVSGIVTIMSLLGRAGDREEVLTEAVRACPEDWLSHAKLAQTIGLSARSEQAAYRDSYRTWQIALRKNPEAAPDEKAKYDELREHVEARLALAREHAILAARGLPYHHGVLTMVILTLTVDVGDYAVAEPYIETLIDIDPDEPAALEGLGAVRYATADYAEAVPVLRRACERRSDNPTPRMHLGMCLLELGEFDAAVDAFAELETLAKEDDRYWNQARLGTAWALVRRPGRTADDVDRADHLVRSVDVRKINADAWSALVKAEVEHAAKREDVAQAWLKRAEIAARAALDMMASPYARERTRKNHEMLIEKTRERLR